MMRTFRVFAFTIISVTALATACYGQHSEHLWMNVASTVHIGRQTLEPGTYEVSAVNQSGVFTIQNARNRKSFFVIAVARSAGRKPDAGRPSVQLAPNDNGGQAIRSMYFPQSELDYSFEVAGPIKKTARPSQPLQSAYKSLR